MASRSAGGRSQRNRRDAAGAANLHQAHGADSAGERTKKLGAGGLQIAMPLLLWQPVRVLLQFAAPEALNFRSFRSLEHVYFDTAINGLFEACPEMVSTNG